MRRVLASGEKPLHWVGSSKRDFLDAYRAVYTVRFEKAVYVLHAFQKKSPSGIRTAKRDVELVAERLKAAQKDHEEQYGKSTR